MVWSTYILPLQDNASMAAVNTKSTLLLYEKVYRNFFSKAKMGAEDKLAYPAECLWVLNDIRWTHKLISGKLDCFDRTKHVLPFETAHDWRSHLLWKATKPLSDLHKNNPYSLGPLHCKSSLLSKNWWRSISFLTVDVWQRCCQVTITRISPNVNG